MASFFAVMSILAYDKIKEKRAAKKAAKRHRYEARYIELESEHSRDQERRIQAQQTGSSQGSDRLASPVITARRRSPESDRASTRSRDGPSSRVDTVLRERRKRGDLARVDSTAR
jgi:hypothetical protein